MLLIAKNVCLALLSWENFLKSSWLWSNLTLYGIVCQIPTPTLDPAGLFTSDLRSTVNFQSLQTNTQNLRWLNFIQWEEQRTKRECGLSRMMRSGDDNDVEKRSLPLAWNQMCCSDRFLSLYPILRGDGVQRRVTLSLS